MLLTLIANMGWAANPAGKTTESGGGVGPPGENVDNGLFRRPVQFTQVYGLYRLRQRRVE